MSAYDITEFLCTAYQKGGCHPHVEEAVTSEESFYGFHPGKHVVDVKRNSNGPYTEPWDTTDVTGAGLYFLDRDLLVAVGPGSFVSRPICFL